MTLIEERKNDELDKQMSKSMNDFYLSDKNYKKAEALVQKYDMTKWDELAKSNQEGIEFVRSKIEKG